MRVCEWGSNSCRTRLFAFEGLRTNHRLYMHDPEDGKASWTKFIPVVLVSNAGDLPSVFCRTVSKAFERFLANHRYESDSELDNTNPQLKRNATDLQYPLYTHTHTYIHIIVLITCLKCSLLKNFWNLDNLPTLSKFEIQFWLRQFQ